MDSFDEDTSRFISQLKSNIAQLRRELEAYKKAKQENDERYMIERDAERKRADLNERAGRLIIEELEYHKDRERIPENMTFEYFRKLAEVKVTPATPHDAAGDDRY